MKQTIASIPSRSLVAALLALVATSALAQETRGTFQLVSHDLPTRLTPGERVVINLAWRVVEPGAPLYTVPVLDFASSVPGGRGVRVDRDHATPWHLPNEQAAGDVCSIAWTLEVPLDMTAGDAVIALSLARNVPDKGWQYASIVDPEGKPSGQRFSWKVTVQGRAEEEAAKPLLVSRMSAPSLDGSVDEAEWVQAARVPQFRESNAGGPASAGTHCHVGYDTENLYLAFVCAEPAMDKVAATDFGKHDASLWNNECVEIFLDTAGDRVSFVHLIADILNQRFDALGADTYGYNPGWQSAVGRAANSWSVEIALPFSSLGVASPREGQAWTGNLCRERKAEPELSAWQPTFGAFAAPGRFGLIVFGSAKEHLLSRVGVLQAGEQGEWPEGIAAEVEAWRGRTGALRERLQSASEDQAEATFGELAATVDALELQLRQLRLKSGRLAGKSFVISDALPYEPFSGDISECVSEASPRAVSMLGEEWVDLAWNLGNLTDRPITLRCMALKGPAADGGYLDFGLPGLATRWSLATPVAAGDGRPVYDAIAPIPAGTVTIPPGCSSQVWLSLGAPEQPLQSTGHVCFEPIDGTAGEPVRLPVSVDVRGPSLTASSEVHCFTWNIALPPVSDDPQWLATHLQDLAEHGIDVCTIHGLRHTPRVKANADGSLSEPLDFTRVDRLLSAASGRFPLYYLTIDIFEKGSVRRDLFGLRWGTPEYEKAFKTWLRLLLDHLWAQGLTHDSLLVNPYDESVGEDCQTLAAWIKAVDPEVRVIIDCSTTDLQTARKMDALTDVWVPHFKYHLAKDHEPFFQLLREGGKPHWVYFYSEGGNDKAQDPTGHYLSKFWWAYQEGITGVCYWAQQYYGDPWYRAAFSKTYDTSLVYPIQGGLVPSRRWEAWRRGWQDYNILAMAKRSLQEAGDEAGLAELDRLVRDVVKVPGDPQKREAAREWARARVGG